MKSAILLIGTALLPVWMCMAQSPAPAAAPPAASTAAPPAAPTVATEAPLAAAQGDAYVIGGNDVLDVTVWKDPTLSGNILVRPDGMISMPLVGDVKAAGLTPLHLASQISEKLKKFVQDPVVSVVVVAIHSKVIYMIGEVAKPGPLDMTPDMTMLEAISSAGGLTEFAKRKKIYILRDQGGKRTRIPVQYKQALNGNRALDLPLYPGDTIVVP